LLLGPPYKVPKESTLQNDEILQSLRLADNEDEPTSTQLSQQPQHQINSQQQLQLSQPKSNTSETQYVPKKLLQSSTGACRLFVFSKQALSENSPDLPPCHLEPMELQIPTEAPGSSSVHSLDPTSCPPLHQALVAYERQFMLYLEQGRVLADGSTKRLTVTRSCVQEQAIMARALRAAVSNLSDYYHRAARTRTEFTAAFQAETSRHGSLLQRFDSVLNTLATIPLHPSLQSIAATAGRPMLTLLDTVPVDREKQWSQECHTAHQRLLNLFQELDTAFSELGTTTTRQEETRQDRLAEEEIESLWYQIETVARESCERQRQRFDKLSIDHREVVRIVTTAIQSDNDSMVQQALIPLGEMSNSSKLVIPEMISDDNTIKEAMIRVAEAKTNAMKRMKVRLRDVSIAQSQIQRCLSSVGVLRDGLTMQTENIVHLEHVMELEQSYKSFLSELRRRRAYGTAVITSTSAVMDRLTTMRSDELKAREMFLRGPAKHLMPAFFEIFVPTLATPPPIFTPQIPAMVEMDTLPDVTDDEIMNAGESSMNDAVMQSQQQDHGVSTSTLTAESTNMNQPQQQQQNRTTTRQSDNTKNDVQHPDQQQQLQQQLQDQLIVSADEITDNMTGTDAVAKAELKTLLNENNILRQELELLREKAITPTVEPSKVCDTDSKKDNEQEIAILQKELANAKEEARLAKEAVDAYTVEKGKCDKISHSSFNINDIVLFMHAGNRTYIAFHTNCPHRYLNTDCVEGTPDFIVGRLLYQEQLVACESNNNETNPYGLAVGTDFWIMTVDVITPARRKK
jgi:Autophagy protein ATG17-like domain/Autophagy-related protein 11